jgi:hypothetical protein
MDSESHTVVLPSTRIGTLPAGECPRIASLVPFSSSGIFFSSKSKPNTFIAIHGRSDHDE